MISYYKRYIIGEETIVEDEFVALMKMPENADSNGDFSVGIKVPEDENK